MTGWRALFCLVFLVVSCEGGGGPEGPDEAVTLPDGDIPSITDNAGGPDTPWPTDSDQAGLPDDQQWPDNEWPDNAGSDSYLPDGAEQPDDGGEDDPLRLYKSGSRIRARFGETPDGAKQFFGWYDNQLGIDCAFVQASDGQYRCLPTPILYISYFADSSCSTPLLAVTAGCNATASWGLTYDSCSRPNRVFQRGSVYGGNTGYMKSGSNCISIDLSNYASIYTFYNAGQEYPLASFQTMSIYTE